MPLHTQGKERRMEDCYLTKRLKDPRCYSAMQSGQPMVVGSWKQGVQPPL